VLYGGSENLVSPDGITCRMSLQEVLDQSRRLRQRLDHWRVADTLKH
jgi:hypothetical protein